MELVLPGLDVNDQNKSEATISLWLSILSNCVAFRGTRDPPTAQNAPDSERLRSAVPLAFDAEDFVLELLRRLAALIDHVDAHGHAGDVEGSSGCGA